MNNGENLSISPFISPDISEEYYFVLTGLHLNLLCQFIFGKLYMKLKWNLSVFTLTVHYDKLDKWQKTDPIKI